MGLTEHELTTQLREWARSHRVLVGDAVMPEEEVVADLMKATSPRLRPQFDRFTKLTEPERMQVEAVGLELMRSGAYGGSDADAVTDAIAIVKAAMFAPPLGDNHHNARECPHCTPDR